MSILLSGYYPEGIVFVADRNVTITTPTSDGNRTDVEPSATKVLSWPHQKAVVGFCGLGILGKLPTDEWMRIFIAETRDFSNIDILAQSLKDRIQSDFDIDFPSGSDISTAHLIIHLGGFALRNNLPTPVMYHIWNHDDIDPQTGDYPPAKRIFDLSEDIERDFRNSSGIYPTRVQQALQKKINNGNFHWYNNGYQFRLFNIFKGAIWEVMQIIQSNNLTHLPTDFESRISYCKMAVEVYSSFFTHYFLPGDRAVGGGVDAGYIPWP
jgi:hypothetical protein